MEIPRKACWRREDVGAVLSNEALEGHEGIFLATHTPIRDFAVFGSHAGEIEGRDEQAVLDALADETRQHAFCVVQGEPGSGKSHLIRWLHVNWPVRGDVKLLLQRADGSLEGALRQLQERLPAEFKDLFDKLGRRHRATVQGRANIFLSNLANALDPDHFDPPLEDAGWCRENRPGDLVGHLVVKRSWIGPARILRLLEGTGSEAGVEWNSESASFNLFDIEALGRCCGGVHGTGVLPATERLAQRLKSEADLISDYRAKEWTSDEIQREVHSGLRTSIQLMDALNRRRNDAVQNLLGVSAEGLKQLFRQIRRELATRGSRLVLLLEDITSWEGIDDSLIDVLVTNADTRAADGEADMCPLISVVGVTPAYYDRLHGNYRGRITHELSLGEAKVAGDLQDVATLRSRESRLAFAARYLSAVRAGEASLRRWRDQRRDSPSASPPNRCDNCSVREGCHQTFGSVDGVGMFPLSENAFERLFDSLNDRDGGMTWKTPRGILQAILGTSLAQPAAIEEGRFPTALIGSRGIVADSRRLSPRLRRVVEGHAPEPEHERLTRMLAYWGDRERADTTRTEDGRLEFAAVPLGIFESFSLPWLGGEAADPGAAPAPQPVAPDKPIVEPEDDTEPETIAPIATGGRSTVRPRPDVPPPPSRRRAPSRSELDRYRDQLRKWSDTGDLESPTHWNRVLYELIQGINPRRIGLDPSIFLRLVTAANVKIEGTGPANRNYLVVGREAWVLDGLEAYLALRLDSHMTADDAEFHRRNLSSMMRRLERTAAAYADRRLSLNSGSERWLPTRALLQILLARAWLRGSTSPDAPPFVQLQAVLSDEGEAASDPAARSGPWQGFLDRTKDWHSRFRDELRNMLALSQGESRSYGLVDVSLAAAALYRFCSTLKFDPVPESNVDTGVTEYDKAREIVTETGGSLARVLRVERDQIEERARTLGNLLRGRSVAAHFERVNTAVETVAKNLPSAAPDQVSRWTTAYARSRERFETGGTRIENYLIGLDDDERPTALGDKLLTALLHAPAKDIEDALGLAQLGEQVISSVLSHVAECVRDGQGTNSLEDVHKVGRKLRSAISELNEKRDDEVAA